MSYIQTKHIISKNTDSDLYTLKLWVDETTNNIPSELFVYRTITFVPRITLTNKQFNSICSYADLLNYGTKSNIHNPFYRQSYIYMSSKSLYELVNFQVAIGEGLQKLITDIIKVNSEEPNLYLQDNFSGS